MFWHVGLTQKKVVVKDYICFVTRFSRFHAYGNNAFLDTANCHNGYTSDMDYYATCIAHRFYDSTPLSKIISLILPYVTIYPTLSHLYDDGLANQGQLKMIQSSTNLSAHYRTNQKVSRRLLLTVVHYWHTIGLKFMSQ